MLARDNLELSVHPAAIEERIWSLMYGLKGDIDLTINATVRKKGILSGGLQQKTDVRMPLEFKSGI